MTEQQPEPQNLPEVAIHPDRRALMNPETDSWVAVVEKVATLAAQIAGTPFVPKGLRDSAPATAAAILYGREIGIPPMTALSAIDIIEGKPSVNAEQMRAMVFAAGHEIDILEYTDARCIMRGRRHGSDRWSPEVEYNINHAKNAGLMGKDNWRKNPRDMCFARATVRLCRAWFPDVIHGMHAAEEIGDEDTTPPETQLKSSSKVQRRRAIAPVAPPDDAGSVGWQPVSGGGVPAPPAPASGPAAAIASAAPPPPPPSAPAPEAQEVPTLPVEGPESPPAGSDEGPSPDRSGEPATKAQLRMYRAEFAKFDLNAPENRDRRMYVTRVLSSEDVGSSNDLTRGGISKVIDTLATFDNAKDLWGFVGDLHWDQADEGGNS